MIFYKIFNLKFKYAINYEKDWFVFIGIFIEIPSITNVKFYVLLYYNFGKIILWHAICVKILLSVKSEKEY